MTISELSDSALKPWGKNDYAAAHIKPQKFWRHVEKTATCWLWTGYLTIDGYGRLETRVDGKDVAMLAHRACFLMVRGPSHLQLDHLCKNKRCVNPWHLEPVTGRENQRRGGPNNPVTRAMHATHCPQTHPYSTDNTYVDPTGRRHCRKCMSEAGKKYRRRQKAQTFWSKTP